MKTDEAVIRNCPHCKREHRISPVLKNKVIRCPFCDKEFWVYQNDMGMQLIPVKDGVQ